MDTSEQVPSPNLSKNTVSALVYRLYGIKDVDISQLNGYYDKNYHIQVNSNNDVVKAWPHGYVLKIINSADSQNRSVIEAHVGVMLYLGENGIKCPQPVKNLKGQYLSMEDLAQDGSKTSKHLVFMLTYQPGRLLKDIPCTNQILYKIGKFVAEVDEILKGYHHPGYESNYITSISLLYISQLKSYLRLIEDKNERDILLVVIDKFVVEVIPKVDSLEKGLVHYDINDQNVLMSKTDNGSWDISALLDFGDAHRTSYVFELVINISHVMLLSSDPVTAAGHVIAGYSTVRPLPEEEFNILKLCICARLCQLILLGMSIHENEPENDYVLGWIKGGAWEVLNLLWNLPKDEVNDKWRNIILSRDL